MRDELATNFIDNMDSFFMAKYFSDERLLDRQCVKRKGLPIKANHKNSTKHDSDSDDSFDRGPTKIKRLISFISINRLLKHKFSSAQNRFIGALWWPRGAIAKFNNRN